ALQCIAEWCSGFSSAALEILISFFADFGCDNIIPMVATHLLENYVLLKEDPDDPPPDHLFWSVFLIELLVSTHLSDIIGFVEVPGWKTRELAFCKDAAGLECEVQFITDGMISMEEVLAEMVENPERKMKIKLPRVFNKATGQESMLPYVISHVAQINSTPLEPTLAQLLLSHLHHVHFSAYEQVFFSTYHQVCFSTYL
ncbi:hypothetical protein PAXRUDRAFT_152421, partial [Paxillus rubicundulus Ve08.2h10]